MNQPTALVILVTLMMRVSLADASPPRVLTANGLGKVHIGMSFDSAQAALDAHFDDTDGTPESQGCWIHGRADGLDRNIGFMFEKNRLTRIEVISSVQSGTDAPITTDRGIGIGSTIEDIKRAYGAAAVVQPDNDGDLYSVDVSGGREGIVFVTDGHAVVSFRAGMHPAVDYYEGCF